MRRACKSIAAAAGAACVLAFAAPGARGAGWDAPLSGPAHRLDVAFQFAVYAGFDRERTRVRVERALARFRPSTDLSAPVPPLRRTGPAPVDDAYALARLAEFYARHLKANSGHTLDDVARAAVDGIDPNYTSRGLRYRDTVAAVLGDPMRSFGFSWRIDAARRSVLVGHVTAGTPAWRAGVRDGDRIVSIDGALVASDDAMRTDLAKPEMRLRLARDPSRTLRFPQRTRRISTVGRTVRFGEALYVRLDGIGNGTPDDLRRALAAQSVPPPNRLILDLRRTANGSLDEAVAVASQFVPQGTPLCTLAGAGVPIAYRAAGGTPLWPGPIAVLAGPNTASSAELLTSALSRRVDAPAVVVGTRTAGDPSTYERLELDDRSGLVLPGGKCFLLGQAPSTPPAQRGVEPDRYVPGRGAGGSAKGDPPLAYALANP